MSNHEPILGSIEVTVRTRRHGGKVTPVRRMRWTLDCSCGTCLGTSLDWIDVIRQWRAHRVAIRVA